MNSPTHSRAIDRLRAERPDETNDPQLDPARMRRNTDANYASPLLLQPRARTRTARRVLATACIAIVALLVGFRVVASDSTHTPTVRSISVAEAKQLAVAALNRVPKLVNFHMVASTSWTEVGGAHRVVSTTTTATVDHGDRMSSTHTRNDFVNQDTRGAEFRTVDGRTYVEAKTRYVQQRWLWSARPGGGAIGNFSTAPPQTAGIIAQLEREQLITAQRSASGTITVEVRRPARELADLDGMMFGTSSEPGMDPIVGFATGIAHGDDPNAIVTARLTIAKNGSLTHIRVSARVHATLPDGHGGAKVLVDTVDEWKLSPPRARIEAPDPHDVMVVGDILQTRHGATGIVGPQKTLDSYTPASLAALRRTMRAHRGAFMKYFSARARAHPARDYSALMRVIARERTKLLAEIAAMPRTPKDLARNDRCTPYWPQSGREMARATGRANPEAAGWRCHLTSVDAYVSSEPDVNGWAWTFVGPGGGGCCFSERDIAKAARAAGGSTDVSRR